MPFASRLSVSSDLIAEPSFNFKETTVTFQISAQSVIEFKLFVRSEEGRDALTHESNFFAFFSTDKPTAEERYSGQVERQAFVFSMPGTRIVLNAGEPDPDPAPYLFLSAEHKRKNAEKAYDPKRYPQNFQKYLEGNLELHVSSTT